MCRSCFVLLAVALATTSLHAQPATSAPPRPAAMLASVDTSLFHGLRFRNVGPPRGGRAGGVTGVGSQPATFYMGVASGAVFKTTNGGQSSVRFTDGKVPVASRSARAVAPRPAN